MKEKVVYTALGATSSTYAKLLDTAEGKEFADEYTWASVVLGKRQSLAATSKLRVEAAAIITVSS